MAKKETLQTPEEEGVQKTKKRRGRPTKAEIAAREAAEAKEKEKAAAEMTVSEGTIVEETATEAPAETAPAKEQPVETPAETPAEVSGDAHQKKRRGRRTKEEILAAAAAAAAAMSQKHATQQELQFVDEEQEASPVVEDDVPAEISETVEGPVGEFIPEAMEDITDGEEIGTTNLLEQLQSKVEAHNAELEIEEEEEIDEVWEDDPADGSDFIILKDLPVEDNAVIPYYDMFDQPTSSSDAGDLPVETFSKAETYNFGDIITTTGVLEVLPEGYGFLRSSDYNYLASPDDVHVNNQMLKRYALKTGDVVECTVCPPMENDKYFTISEVVRINGREPRVMRDRVSFENLTPLFPDEKFNLCGDRATTNLSTRIVDLFSPIGKGQRALIVAQPKTGKTILMKDIANAIAANHPEAYIMMLLIDERPEEVTDMARTVNAEVIASTFDEPADRHVKIAGLVLEKAKRLVECGHDVVIFLDSITRLARAYNTVAPASGKVLTGGVDANALQKPKRFFGAARNIEGGGSLTIIATALTDTGSKMDEVIFEEFKGTGNSELQLDRQLANRRIFPAVNLVQSSTRRDDLLLDDTTINRMWILRKHIADMNATEAMNEIHGLMQRTRSNDDFLLAMNG